MANAARRAIAAARAATTYSGRQLDLDDCTSDAIFIEDIAAALSKVCRFGAQASAFYSVAQHAVLVHDLVVEAGHRELAATALHHDSAEAYVCDLPSPLKALLHAKGNHAYREAADRLDQAIAIALGHTPYDESSPSGAEIKLADLRALLIEAAELLPDRGEGIRAYLGAGRVAEIEDLMTAFPEPLVPTAAEKLFLRRHAEAARGIAEGLRLRGKAEPQREPARGGSLIVASGCVSSSR